MPDLVAIRIERIVFHGLSCLMRAAHIENLALTMYEWHGESEYEQTVALSLPSRISLARHHNCDIIITDSELNENYSIF